MPTGFTRTATGFRAWVRVSSKRDDFDVTTTKRFPRAATPKDIRDWRKAERDRLRVRLEQHRQQRAERLGTSGSFLEDAQNYLLAVQAMPSYVMRARDIALWVAIFGRRRRADIKPHEIRAVRDQWLTVGPRRRMQRVNGKGQWIDVAEPLSASTVNHRLRALSNMWTVLDGRRAHNPVHDVPEANEPGGIPRAIHYDTIRLILAAMADRGRPVKDKPRPPESLAKVRARVMAWTGIEPTELGRLAEQDIVDGLEAAVLAVPGRRKGSGAPARYVPLNEEAVAALKDLVRLGACGPFNGRAVLRSWQIACRKTVGRTFRLKDLRHSFVTAVTLATKDLKLAGRLVGHKDDRTTARYGVAALLPLLRAGVDATFPATDKETKS